VGGGPWLPMTATDGAYGGTSEGPDSDGHGARAHGRLRRLRPCWGHCRRVERGSTVSRSRSTGPSYRHAHRAGESDQDTTLDFSVAFSEPVAAQLLPLHSHRHGDGCSSGPRPARVAPTRRSHRVW